MLLFERFLQRSLFFIKVTPYSMIIKRKSYFFCNVC